jgi:hypothetical protein
MMIHRVLLLFIAFTSTGCLHIFERVEIRDRVLKVAESTRPIGQRLEVQTTLGGSEVVVKARIVKQCQRVKTTRYARQKRTTRTLANENCAIAFRGGKPGSPNSCIYAYIGFPFFFVDYFRAIDSTEDLPEATEVTNDGPAMPCGKAPATNAVAKVSFDNPAARPEVRWKKAEVEVQLDDKGVGRVALDGLLRHTVKTRNLLPFLMLRSGGTINEAVMSLKKLPQFVTAHQRATALHHFQQGKGLAAKQRFERALIAFGKATKVLKGPASDTELSREIDADAKATKIAFARHLFDQAKNLRAKSPGKQILGAYSRLEKAVLLLKGVALGPEHKQFELALKKLFTFSERLRFSRCSQAEHKALSSIGPTFTNLHKNWYLSKSFVDAVAPGATKSLGFRTANQTYHLIIISLNPVNVTLKNAAGYKQTNQSPYAHMVAASTVPQMGGINKHVGGLTFRGNMAERFALRVTGKGCFAALLAVKLH